MKKAICTLVFFGLLFVSQTIFAKSDFSICAIFKNEAPYLKEWIEFHKLQGVDHFFLYNNNSTDDYRSVLDEYISDDSVTLIDWHYDYKDASRAFYEIQCGAYTHCLKTFCSDVEWLAAIDVDEFLFSPSGEKLPKLLEEYKEFGGLSVNWMLFGTSFLEEIPEGQLQIESLTRYGFTKLEAFVKRLKCIVQPKYTLSCDNPHYFKYIEGKFAVGTDFNRTEGIASNNLNFDKIRLNHYWTRTEKYWREVKLPRRAKFTDDDSVELLNKFRDEKNEFENRDILQFVPELKAKVFKNKLLR